MNTVKTLKKAGFNLDEVGVYIFAVSEQESLDIKMTVELVKSEGLRPMIAEYSPIPGTSLLEKAVDCSPFPIAKEPLFQNNTLLPCLCGKFILDDLNELKRESKEGFH